MDPLTIIGLLAQFGPSLLKSLGAGKNVQAVADTAAAVATAVTGKADVNEAAQALAADPALQLEFQTKLIAQESQFEQNYVDDKANARARDLVLASTPKGNVRANWLTGMAIVIICAILTVVMYPPLADQINEFAKGVITTILGGMLQQLYNIYAFEFGTTRRSQQKTDALSIK